MHARPIIFLRCYNICQQFANIKTMDSQLFDTICDIRMTEGRLRRRGSVLFPGSEGGHSL